MRDLESFEAEGIADSSAWQGSPALEVPPAPRRLPPPGPACAIREVMDGFDQNQSVLKPEHVTVIRRVARCIRDSQRSRQPIRSVRIVGHASEEGTDAHNMALGQDRANAVLTRLRQELEFLQRGLGRRVALRPESRGERELTHRGREHDRRVEIHLPHAVRPRPPRARGCAPQRERIRLHIKILADPQVPIATMVRAMRDVYHPAGFRVEIASTERLALPNLVDLDIHCPGSATAQCCPFPCPSAGLNAEVVELFTHRNHVRGHDVVVYFVRATSNLTLGGCCAHPPGRPGCVVTQIAAPWTMAHEVGHVLGLPHVAGNQRLMFAFSGPGLPPHPPPTLVASEVATMTASVLTVPC